MAKKTIYTCDRCKSEVADDTELNTLKSLDMGSLTCDTELCDTCWHILNERLYGVVEKFLENKS